MDTAPSTTQEPVGQLLVRSLKLYRVAFFHVILLSLMMSIIVFIPRLIALAIGQDIFAILPLLSPHRLWLIVIDLGGLIFFSAILWRVRCLLRNQHESLLADLEIAIKKLPLIIIATIIQMALVLCISFVVFGFYSYLGVHQIGFLTNPLAILIVSIPFLFQLGMTFFIFYLFLFYLPLIVIENDGAIVSLKQSAHLVWKHWWQTFCMQITPWLSYLLLLIILRNIPHLNIHIYFLQATPPSLIGVILNIIIFALFIPWAATAMLIQLHDLELRTPPK